MHDNVARSGIVRSRWTREHPVKRRLLGVLALVVMWSVRGVPAQDEPFLGTWECNLAKSSITRGAPPKSESIVNMAEAGGFRSTLTSVTERGKSVEIHHYIFDGNFHQTEGGDPRELSFTRTSRRTIESDTRRNGQMTVHRRFELSEDGKTMTVVASGVSGGGQKYTNDTRVYERR
jgi:hypothetical protein